MAHEKNWVAPCCASGTLQRSHERPSAWMIGQAASAWPAGQVDMARALFAPTPARARTTPQQRPNRPSEEERQPMFGNC